MEFWFSEFHTPDVKHSIRVNKQLYSKQSDYQRIDIFETPEFGRVLTLDGNVMLTERTQNLEGIQAEAIAFILNINILNTEKLGQVFQTH